MNYFDSVVQKALDEEALQAKRDQQHLAYMQDGKKRKSVESHCRRLRGKPKKLAKYIQSTYGTNKGFFPVCIPNRLKLRACVVCWI